ncbi:MAG: glutaredoxin family protein [Bacillota bacterium]
MKEFLSQKGVDFQEYNVADNDSAREEMLAKTGRMAVPTIMVGNEVIIGFDRERLEGMLH